VKKSLWKKIALAFGILLAAVGLWFGIRAVLARVKENNRAKFEARIKPEIEKRLRGETEPGNTIYYLSPNGNDANDGKSTETAWQTIKKVNQINFNPSDQILFEGGQTFKGNLQLDADDAGTPANPIKIGSYGEGRATINAENGSGILVENSMGFEISNLNIVGSGREKNSGDGIAFVNNLRGNLTLENIKIQSVEISGFGGYGIKIEGTEDKSGYRNVLIENTESHDNTEAGVYVFAKTIVGEPKYAHEKVIVRRVKAYKNSGKSGMLTKHSGSGIVLSDVDGGMIEQSTAFENGWLCNSRDGGPVGIWAWDSNNIVIQNNESYSNKTSAKDGGGFDLDGGVTNSVLQYNYSHDNDGPGYLLMQYDYAREWGNNVMRYNISENDVRKGNYGAIHFWGEAKNASVYHNVVVNSPNEKFAPGAIDFHPHYRDPNMFPKDIKIYNNIFVISGGIPIIDSESDEKTIVFRNNNFFTNNSNWHIIWGKSTFQSLEEWSQQTGQERNNEQFTALSVNPNFTDCGGRNDFFSKQIAYCLKPDSPLIDKGLDLKKIYQIEPGESDFRGKKTPIGNYEIGAFEVEK
jgi:hypothetical protein